MLRRWVGRRRLTLCLVAGFAAWYLVQLAVAATHGRGAAVWWFYVAGDPSPGHLLGPVSHDVADAGHLGRNACLLLVAGGLAEPRLGGRRSAALLLALAAGSIAATNALSLAAGTQWTLAGPSGGIFGLWAYAGVRYRGLVRGAGGWRRRVEAAAVLAGLLAAVVVPAYELSVDGAVNVTHALGILLGYGVALAAGSSVERDDAAVSGRPAR